MNGTGKIGRFRIGYWYFDGNGTYAWDAVDVQHIGYFGQTGDTAIIKKWSQEKRLQK